MESTVMELILCSFRDRTLEDQLRIVRGGRPLPNVNPVPQNGATDGVMAKFEELTDGKVQWLTSCPIRRGCFCWPCLLFNDSENYWNRHGFSEWHSLSENMREHEITFEHIQAELQLKMFCLKYIKSSVLEMENNIKQRAVAAERRRVVLKVLIDMVCYRVAREYAPQRGNYSTGLLDPKYFMKALDLMRDYGNRDVRVTDEVIELITKSPTIISDLVDSITAFLKLEIKKEANSTTHVSVILTEHSEDVGKSRISTVLRYIKGVETYERFIGFTNIRNSGHAGDVFEHVSNVLNEFGLSEQFLAYSLDGAVLPLKALPDFVKQLKEKYPQSVFVPWCCHIVEDVLLQGLSGIKECNHFFRNINRIKYLFRENSNALPYFRNCMFENKSSLRSWFHNTHIVFTICMYRKELVSWFGRFESSQALDADDVSIACGYRLYLEQVQAIFLLKLFDKIFKTMCKLSAMLRSSSPESIFGDSVVETLINNLSLFRSKGFPELWISVLRELSLPVPPESGEYRKLFDTILDHVLEQLRVRFDDLSELEFSLPTIREKCLQSVASGSRHVSQLVTAQGDVIYKEDICNELNILLQDGEYSGHADCIKSLFEFLVHSGMKSALPNLFRFAEVCYTLPIRRPCTDITCISKHKDIVKCSYYLETTTTRDDAAVLLVELNLLQQLRESKTFSDEVLSIFNSKVSDTAKLL